MTSGQFFPPLVNDAATDDTRSRSGYGTPKSTGRLTSAVSLPTVDMRFSEFLERQANASQEVRLELAKMQRDRLEHMRQTSASIKFNGIPAFKMLLQQRYGSIPAAWRQCLDPTNIGKVSFVDFCKCCRDLGYQKKMKQLWAELDTNKQGWISLGHIDPDAAKLIGDFNDLVQEKHGSMLNAWYWFDENKNHRIDLDEFIPRCGQMGLTGNVRQVFNCLKKDVSRKYLTMQDFDEASTQCLYRGDTTMMTSTPKRGLKKQASQRSLEMPPIQKSMSEPNIDDSPGSPNDMVSTVASWSDTPTTPTSPNSPSRKKNRHGSTLNVRWLRQQSMDQIRAREELKRKRDQLDKGLKSLAALKRELVKRFGSIYAAWRQALDLDGNNRLSFGEFCIALRNLGYGGNVKDVWKALDRDEDGFVCLIDLDPKISDEIVSYKNLATKKHGNMLAVWHESLNANGSGQVDAETFGKHCEEIGWSGSTSSLFQNLKEDRARRFLTLRDLDIRAWNANNRGDMEMLSEDRPNEQTPSITKMDFFERQGQSFSLRWARMNAKLIRSEAQQLGEEQRAKDQGAATADTLKILLVRRYGTMPAAWKHALDVNGNGKLPFGEFCKAMQQLGFKGDIRRIFDTLDSEQKGHLIMKDLDWNAHEALEEFRSLILDKYGTYIKAWSAMDTNKNGCLEEPEMVAICSEIGYKRNPSRLFRYLLDSPGKRSITMADLDPAAMRAYWRGDLEALSPLEKAKAQREKIEKAEQERKALRMDACDWVDFKKALVRDYGSVLAGWRKVMDVSAHGKVSFLDFSKAARKIGFVGNIKKTFNELDNDLSGIITFNEVDRTWYENLTQFHQCMTSKHTSVQKAWAALDANKNGIVDAEEFATFCQGVGYTGPPKGLFQLLLLDHTRTRLQVEDVECILPIISANKQDPNSTKVFHKRESSAWTPDERARVQIASRQAAVSREKTMDLGACEWSSFKEHLIAKYGTIFAAWRNALNKNDHGKISFNDFSAACRENGYAGNIGTTFQNLDQESRGVITFKEVDQGWYHKLVDFHKILRERFGTDENAWQALDYSNCKMLECERFVKACKGLGYGGDLKALFKQMVKHPDNRYITPEDLEALSLLPKGVLSSSKGFLESSWDKRSQWKKNEATSGSLPKSKSSPAFT